MTSGRRDGHCRLFTGFEGEFLNAVRDRYVLRRYVTPMLFRGFRPFHWQELGSVGTPPGRCIAFPNNYQHYISSSRPRSWPNPGHQKIIALFLVDPECTIPSTTHVPPQQSDWTREVIGTADTLFSRLPTELLDMVVGAAQAEGALMTQDESKAYRLKMMERRKGFEEELNDC